MIQAICNPQVHPVPRDGAGTIHAALAGIRQSLIRERLPDPFVRRLAGGEVVRGAVVDENAVIERIGHEETTVH